MDLHYVANGAVGAFDDYCAGYLDPGATGLGYITTLKLSIGMVKAGTDIGLERIVSYDRAEKNDAYIGQINIITASSFCGLNGAVWGYHLAKADRLVKGNVKPIKILKRCDNQKVPLIPVEPLLDATERLFGKAEKRRFPPLPGAMVACATKNRTVEGPTKVWCAIALAIAENREKDSNLIVEDTSDTRHFGPEPLDNLKENIGEAILLCGEDQNVKYNEIFFGVKELVIPEGYVGCALTCAPYVTLAKNAIPKGCEAADLLNMNISEWENKLHLETL